MKFTLLLGAALSLFGNCSIAQACSCVELTPKETHANARFVFVGKVDSVDRQETDPPVQVARVTPSQVFKGKVPKSVTLSRSRSATSCDAELTAGNEMLFYTKDLKSWPMLCGGPKELSDAGDDLKWLKKHSARKAMKKK